MAGRTFSVYDVTLVRGARKRVALESHSATRRVFIQADKGRWTYLFADGESRRLDTASLERQSAGGDVSDAESGGSVGTIRRLTRIAR